MGVNSTVPTSRRRYLSQSELAQYADITLTNPTEADDRISQAEEIIDNFVGYQQKAVSEELIGTAQSGGATSMVLESIHCNVYQKDYLSNCCIEIIGGTGKGQRSTITASELNGTITYETLSTPTDNTSFYKIWQLGKFPRLTDRHTNTTSTQYYYSIPEAIKRAVAAQVEFGISMGDDYFSTNKLDMQSESIGDYSYSKGGGGSGSLDNLIAPKAKLLLRGIKNITGQII